MSKTTDIGHGNPRDPFLSEMLRGNKEVINRARDMMHSITPEQMGLRSPSGGWSVGQVFEHIDKSGRLYTTRIDALIDTARTQGKTHPRQWKPSLIGGAIARSLVPTATTPRKTFHVFEPPDESRPNAIQEVIEMHEQIARQIWKADGLDLRAVRLSSPVSPLLRLNLGDAFAILVYHGQRHLLQVDRIIQARSSGAPPQS